MRAKVFSIVQAAVDSGCSMAAFGAFGSAAHGHPPGEVARFFRDALWYVGIEARLEQVVFAMYEDHKQRPQLAQPPGKRGAF
eukprot:4247976-Alexandrium_andersonii.AAC.1